MYNILFKNNIKIFYNSSSETTSITGYATVDSAVTGFLGGKFS